MKPGPSSETTRNSNFMWTIAQAVSHILPTAVARVWNQGKLCGICGGQSDTGPGIFQVLWFPYQSFIPSNSPQSSSIIQGWYNRPINDLSTRGLSYTRAPKENRNFPAFYGTNRIIFVFTRDSYCPCPKPDKSKPYQPYDPFWYHPLTFVCLVSFLLAFPPESCMQSSSLNAQHMTWPSNPLDLVVLFLLVTCTSY
jgi:hypothetical protein